MHGAEFFAGPAEGSAPRRGCVGACGIRRQTPGRVICLLPLLFKASHMVGQFSSGGLSLGRLYPASGDGSLPPQCIGGRPSQGRGTSGGSFLLASKEGRDQRVIYGAGAVAREQKRHTKSGTRRDPPVVLSGLSGTPFPPTHPGLRGGTLKCAGTPGRDGARKEMSAKLGPWVTSVKVAVGDAQEIWRHPGG